MKKSKYKYLKGAIIPTLDYVKKFVPNFENAEGRPLVEMLEWPNTLFVSEDFMNEVFKEEIENVYFYDFTKSTYYNNPIYYKKSGRNKGIIYS